jgi:hypothetical protein
MEAEPTHRELSRYAIRLLRPDCGAEVNHFRDVIEQASVDEDNGARSLNHFYDPDTGLGLPVNSYTRAYDFFLGSDPAPRAGVLHEYYLNALDWAWDRTPDHLDWTGAIDAYDYSEASRRRAYQAVGHVLHLVEDMGQPDHASCRPHPGNSTHKYLANVSPQIKAWARESGGIRDDRLGYEELWARISPTDEAWRHGSRPKTLSSLAQAFDELARASKATEAGLGLPSVNDGEIALGLAPLRGPAKGWLVKTITGAMIVPPLRADTPAGLKYEWHIPLVPTIPVPPGDSLTTAYLQLGGELMPLVEEYGAGLIELFHAIVNPPPFVSSVKIDQSRSSSSGGMYWRHWEADQDADGRVPRRSLVDSPDSRPVTAGRPARLEIGFGPCLQLGDTTVGKKVAVTGVRIEYDSGRQEELVPFAADRTYVASFTPFESGTLAIEARDLGDHLEGRLPTGEELDSDPSTPARAVVSGSDPGSPAAYGWRHYEPGVDRNHKFTVADQCQADSVRPAVWQAMRYGTLTGRDHVHAECDWATHDGPGEGGGRYEYDRWDRFRCRVVIRDDWPVPSAYSFGPMQATFGHMLDGQIKENAIVKYRPLRYRNVPSDTPEPKVLKFSNSRKPRNVMGSMEIGGMYRIGFDDSIPYPDGRWTITDVAAEMNIPDDRDDIVHGYLPPWYPGIPPNVDPPWPAGPDTALCESLTSSGTYTWGPWGAGGQHPDTTFNNGSMEQSWTVTLSQSDDLPPHAVPELFSSYLPPEAIQIHAEAVVTTVGELVRSGAGSGGGPDQQQWSEQLNDLWNQARRAEQMQMPDLSNMKSHMDQLWLDNADDAYNEGLEKLRAESKRAAVVLHGLETDLADSVDGFAASVRATSAVTADRLAKLAQQLRTGGLKGFGVIVHC